MTRTLRVLYLSTTLGRTSPYLVTTPGWGSASSPTSEAAEEGGEESVPGRRGSRAPRSPGAGEDAPTRTQSSPEGLGVRALEVDAVRKTLDITYFLNFTVAYMFSSSSVFT